MTNSNGAYQLAVVKIASRCNLNCSYCYMYNMGDTTYKNQPKVMRSNVIKAMAERVYNHCKKNDVEVFSFVFHGGEPLLVKKEFFNEFDQIVKQVFKNEVQVSYQLQTNGVLLDEAWCDTLSNLNCSIGLSMDGTPESNNKYRVDHAGRGAYSEIVRGLKTMQKHEYYNDKTGVLCVIDIESDPVETFRHFEDLGVSVAEFLKPDQNYDKPLDKAKRHHTLSAETPIADWLIAIFDEWFTLPKRNLKISFFETIIHAILGEDVKADIVSSGVNEFLTIETDGSIEPLDVLRICGDGFNKRNLNVLTNEIDEAFDDELAKIFYYSHHLLPKKWLACPVKEICGGGYFPHRYSSAHGFNNPSIYCNDLLKLITHIQNKVLDQLPQQVKDETGVQKLTYQNALTIIKEQLPFVETPDYIEQLEEFRTQPTENNLILV